MQELGHLGVGAGVLRDRAAVAALPMPLHLKKTRACVRACERASARANSRARDFEVLKSGENKREGWEKMEYHCDAVLRRRGTPLLVRCRHLAAIERLHRLALAHACSGPVKNNR